MEKDEEDREMLKKFEASCENHSLRNGILMEKN